MEQEVNKLISFVGFKGVIKVSDIETLVIPELNDEVMSLINAIIGKDKKRALKLYNTLSNNTQDIMGILSILSTTFVDLLKVASLLKEGYKQGEIATILGISNGRAYYLVNDAKKYKFEVIEENVLKLSNLDYQIKTGQVDKNLGFEFLLLSM